MDFRACYSYNLRLTNLRKILYVAEIDEDKFLKKAYKVLIQDYADIDLKNENILYQMCHNKKNSIKFMFNSIELADLELRLEEFKNLR